MLTYRAHAETFDTREVDGCQRRQANIAAVDALARQEGVETLGSQIDGVTFRHDSPSASRAERGRARRFVPPDSTCHASERRSATGR